MQRRDRPKSALNSDRSWMPATGPNPLAKRRIHGGLGGCSQKGFKPVLAARFHFAQTVKASGAGVRKRRQRQRNCAVRTAATSHPFSNQRHSPDLHRFCSRSAMQNCCRTTKRPARPLHREAKPRRFRKQGAAEKPSSKLSKRSIPTRMPFPSSSSVTTCHRGSSRHRRFVTGGIKEA